MGDVLPCRRCAERGAVARTGPLNGLCLVCVENDATGAAAADAARAEGYAAGVEDERARVIDVLDELAHEHRVAKDRTPDGHSALRWLARAEACEEAASAIRAATRGKT